MFSIPTALAFLALATTSLEVVNGLPGGAAGCGGGVATGSGLVAVASTHVSRNGIGNGTIEDGGFEVTIGGSTLSAPPSTDTTFIVGQEYDIVLSGSPFLGHLLRIGSYATSPVDCSTALSLSSSESTDSQLASVCNAPVTGVTHVSNSEKTNVSTSFSCPEVSGEYILDVNVVTRNCGPSSASPVTPCDSEESTYYHSYYLFKCDVEQPTPGPATPGPAEKLCYAETSQVQTANNNDESVKYMSDLVPGEEVRTSLSVEQADYETVYGLGHVVKETKKGAAYQYRQLHIETTATAPMYDNTSREKNSFVGTYTAAMVTLSLLVLAFYYGGAWMTTK